MISQILYSLSVFIIVTHIIQLIVYFFILKRTQQPQQKESHELPSVSICMAARDEELIIEQALQSLLNLDYPVEKLTIWIADDQSSDGTATVVKRYTHQHSHFHYYLVSNKFKGIRGKQNALANVIKQSDSELIAIVDADTSVSQNWLKELVSNMYSDTVMVSGVTAAKSNGDISSLTQQFDWMYGSAILKAHADMGNPISGLGNNMIFCRNNYDELGGYESLGHCLNEDFKITHALCSNKPSSFRQIMSPDSTNLVASVSPFIKTISQKYRWLKGAKDAAWYHHIALALPYWALFSCLLLLIIEPITSLTLLIIKMLADILLRFTLTQKMNLKSRSYFLPIWYILSLLTFILVPMCFFVSKKITWKGRKV